MNHRLIILMAVLAILVAACGGGGKDTGGVTGDLMVVYTGNIGGKFEPCGCSPPMGGMARRASIVKAVREGFENVLVLDSGALLYVSNFLTPPTDEANRLDAWATAVLAGRAGLDLVNVGSYDLANGVDSLITMEHAVSSYDWISSNLVWRSTGEHVFQPDTLVVRDGITTGVFGLLSDNYFGTPLYRDPSPIQVTDLIETAKTEVAKLSPDSDLVIALAYMSPAELEQLLAEVQGIDIVLFSHNGMHLDAASFTSYVPRKVGNTLVAQCTDGGRAIGALELHIDNGSTEFENLADITRLGISAEGRSTYRNTFFSLGDQIVHDPDVEPLMNAYSQSNKAFREELGIELEEE